MDSIDSNTNSIHCQQAYSRCSFEIELRQGQTTAATPDRARSPLSKLEETYDVGNKLLAFDGNNDKRTGSHSCPSGAPQAFTDTSDPFRSVSHQRRSSSTDTVKWVPVEPAKVHFAASPYLQARSKASENYTPSFRNPFSEDLEAQSRRASDSSQISDISLPSGFGGHRDTLALLLDEADDADGYEEQDSYSDTPTQTRYTLVHKRRFPLR